LGSDEDVSALFYALKDAAGNLNNEPHVTFDEFARGIIEFPFLLEQFKQEYESYCSQRNSVSHLESPLGDEDNVCEEIEDDMVSMD
jgi:hypothetical protein